MSDQIDIIIQKIKSFDLRKYPYNEIKKELQAVGGIGFVLNTLHPNYDIIRCRPNWKNETFKTIDEISYKPAPLNTTYQRASTPHKTMFYGCSSQKGILGASPWIGRETALKEAMPLLREDSVFGEWKVTYSKWTVIEDINLATICFNKEYHEAYPDHKAVYEEFMKFLDQHIEHREKTIEFVSFLAEQFSSPLPASDTDFLYLISAIFAEVVSENQFEGIIYPSVRTIGVGINIAINPETVHKKLTCVSVGECTVRKDKSGIDVENGPFVILAPGQTDFDLSR